MSKKVSDYVSIVSTCCARLFNDKHQGLWNDIQKYYPDVNYYFYHENSYENKTSGQSIDFDSLDIPSSYHIYDLFKEFGDLEDFLTTSKFNTCGSYDKADMNQGYWKANSLYWFRKAPSIYHAAKQCKTPLLIFLDADQNITPVGSNTSEDEYTIDDLYIEWASKHDVLSRHRPGLWTETGHIVFNLDAGGKEFIERFYDFYKSGKVFELYRWDDCWVFDTLTKEMRINNGPLSKKTGAPEDFEGIVDHHKGKWQHIRVRK